MTASIAAQQLAASIAAQHSIAQRDGWHSIAVAWLGMAWHCIAQHREQPQQHGIAQWHGIAAKQHRAWRHSGIAAQRPQQHGKAQRHSIAAQYSGLVTQYSIAGHSGIAVQHGIVEQSRAEQNIAQQGMAQQSRAWRHGISIVAQQAKQNIMIAGQSRAEQSIAEQSVVQQYIGSLFRSHYISIYIYESNNIRTQQ